MCGKNFILLLVIMAILFSFCGKMSSTLEQKFDVPSRKDAVKFSSANMVDSLKKDREIVRKASLRIEVDSLEKVRLGINSLIKEKGAYISNESQRKSGSNFENSLVIKVPSANFDGFVQTICKLGKYLAVKEINSEDVSMQYIDLQARLNSKKELEARYINLVRKANKVDDLINLEETLSNVRSDIENLEGQFHYINNEISYCTVNIVFYEIITPISARGLNYKAEALHSFQNGWNLIVDSSLLLLTIWPVVFLICLFYYINKKFKIRKYFS